MLISGDAVSFRRSSNQKKLPIEEDKQGKTNFPFSISLRRFRSSITWDRLSSMSAGRNPSPDFNLSDEILAVIPTDPFEQLEVAMKITSMAISSRVVDLDLEVNRLRQSIVDKDRTIGELQGEIGRLEVIAREADARLREVIDQNAKLSKERYAMEVTVRRLSRDFAKLEKFKKHLMETLNEDNISEARNASMDSIDSGSSDQFASKASFFKDDVVVMHDTSELAQGSAETRNMYQLESNNGDQKLSLTLISSRFTPSATPKVTSSRTSPKGYSAAGSPKMASGVTSPVKARIHEKIVISPWYSSSQISSASSSPPPGRPSPGPTRIDGKEFFRKARNRLSYEQFAAFLSNIKEFNVHKQSLEETMKKADEIFGIENKDLYSSFQGMLTRNLP